MQVLWAGLGGYWALVREGVDAFTADIADWVGSVDHVYLNTEDNVTVGIGTLLATSDAAAALDFRRNDTGELATQAEIRAEFDLIDGMIGS